MARTVFVNPSRRRKTRRTKRKNTTTSSKLAFARGKAAGMQMAKANPRRRRKTTRRRRRNAGIVPFVANPMILSNPRKRTRRRRRNPAALPTLKTALNRTMSFGGGAAIGVAANTYLLNGIDSPLMRNAARVAAAVLGAGFLRGELGGATGGALLYPAVQELMDTFMGAGVAATDADLDMLAADLEDVMDELDFDEDDGEELYEW